MTGSASTPTTRVGITGDTGGAFVPDDESKRRSARRTWRRRKRSVIGKEWTPPGLQDVHAGVWCQKCHLRHPYNGRDKLVSQYEQRSDRWVLMWICPKTNNVVGEIWLGSSSSSNGP